MTTDAPRTTDNDVEFTEFMEQISCGWWNRKTRRE
jgi:hypothetical protein